MARQPHHRRVESESDPDGSDSGPPSSGPGPGADADVASDSESDSGSESDSSQRADRDKTTNGFLDVEADEGDDSHDSDVESIPEAHQFHQFTRLPIELREHIWSFFCPDLHAEHRILQFEVSSDSTLGTGLLIQDGLSLMQLTLPIRRVLAAHRESRAFALSKFPSTLSFNRDSAILPFHPGKDIIYLSKLNFDDIQMSPGDYDLTVPGFSDKLCHLALEIDTDPNFDPTQEELIGGNHFPAQFHYAFLLSFARLEALYLSADSCNVPASDLAWCVSDHARRVDVYLEEIEPGLGENVTIGYRWHGFSDCARDELCAPLRKIAKDEEMIQSHLEDVEAEECLDWLLGIKEIPMRYFMGSDLKRLHRLESRGRADFDKPVAHLFDSDFDKEEEDEDTSEEENEYESDGIDDAPVGEPETEDEDERGSGIEDDTLAMELMSHSRPSRNGFSPLEDSDSGEQSDGVVEINSSDSSDEDAQPRRSPVKRSAQRRVVLDDSDEEDEEEGQDDGGEDESLTANPEPARRGMKRSRVVLSDDEDDSGDEVAKVDVRPAKRRAPPAVSEDEDSEDDSESEMEVVATRNVRPNRPAPVAAASDSEEAGDSDGPNDYGVNYDEDADDDEDEEKQWRDDGVLDVAEVESEDGDEDEGGGYSDEYDVEGLH